MAGGYDFKTTGFEFKGFKDLYRSVEHLPETVLKRQLEPILIKSLLPIRDLARAIAPDDPLTGPPWNLPTSIEVGTKQRSGRARRNRQLGKYDARAYVGPTKYGYPQAIFQEFGRMGDVARPFMRPAWDVRKEKVLEIIQENLGKRLIMIAKKYGPKG